MTQWGTWIPYAGISALSLAFVLLGVAVLLTYLGTQLTGVIGVKRPGRAVGGFLLLFWGLSLVTFLVAIVTYALQLYQQHLMAEPPTNPISPITTLSGIATFILIAYATRSHGVKIALGSAFVGTAAAPMIFELPFDLIVMGRTYPPIPPSPDLFRLLFFLPLFLVEASTFSLLTLSPLTRVSRYTLFTLAAMFLVFAIWALFNFSYPSDPIPLVLNGVSKILSFVTAITLFLKTNRSVP